MHWNGTWPCFANGFLHCCDRLFRDMQPREASESVIFRETLSLQQLMLHIRLITAPLELHESDGRTGLTLAYNATPSAINLSNVWKAAAHIDAHTALACAITKD